MEEELTLLIVRMLDHEVDRAYCKRAEAALAYWARLLDEPRFRQMI